jgi:release factor H-coupled RctB family protein
MGNSPNVDGPVAPIRAQVRAPIHTFYSANAWIEGDATRQLNRIAAEPGILAVAAMPDLHPGKYGPVGCAILSQTIRPEFVGSDIGCGMGLFQLDVAVRKLRLDKTAERLRDLDGQWASSERADMAAALAQSRIEAGVAATDYDGSLGTVGGGNHFCELQAIEEIVSADIAAAAGLDADQVHVLVHSGSRGLGNAILDRHLADRAGSAHLAEGGGALDPTSARGLAYARDHDHAVSWARANRAAIAARAAVAARGDLRAVADLAHNLMEVTPAGVLHRKGAAASDRGLVPIPGSRGTLSYLVQPLFGASPAALASLAHGAGRKYDRASMHGRVQTKKSDLDKLVRNPFGGLIVCENRDLLVEEAPDAYKNIGRVIDDLVAFGLCQVVATFRPLVTFKTAGKAAFMQRAPNGRNVRDKEGRR